MERKNDDDNQAKQELKHEPDSCRATAIEDEEKEASKHEPNNNRPQSLLEYALSVPVLAESQEKQVYESLQPNQCISFSSQRNLVVINHCNVQLHQGMALQLYISC
jgi:hypothetical protein